jgi:hypothetical protein
MYLCNAFSLNMLADLPASISVKPMTQSEAQCLAQAGLISAVGHADTAAVFAAILGVPVEPARITVTLNKGDAALVGQYSGPRLPEGATTLPEGATIRWLLVSVE